MHMATDLRWILTCTPSSPRPQLPAASTPRLHIPLQCTTAHGPTTRPMQPQSPLPAHHVPTTYSLQDIMTASP